MHHQLTTKCIIAALFNCNFIIYSNTISNIEQKIIHDGHKCLP